MTAEISIEAREDLRRIFFYLAENASESVAENMTRELIDQCAMIAENPLMGRSRYELLPEMRSLAHRPYVIFYKPAATGIIVIRVLHGARDIVTLFSSTF